jgi:chromosome segregation ATPase
MALTDAQVWAAADELEARGERATLMALRKALGGGSFSTISDAMTQRRKRQTPEQEMALPVPQPLEDHLNTVGRQMWAAALAHAGERLRADRDQFDRSRLILEGERDEALDLANQLTSEIEAAQTRIDDLASTTTLLQQTANENHTKLAKCCEQLAAANAKNLEAAQHIANLSRELERVNETNLSLIAALANGGASRNPVAREQ